MEIDIQVLKSHLDEISKVRKTEMHAIFNDLYIKKDIGDHMSIVL